MAENVKVWWCCKCRALAKPDPDSVKPICFVCAESLDEYVAALVSPRLTPLEVAKLAHSDATIAMMDAWALFRDAEKGSAGEKLAGPNVQPAIEAAQKALAAVRSEREKEEKGKGEPG